MKCLERNKQTIWYALYLGKTERMDADGYVTGERTAMYGEPIMTRMSISAAKGTAELEQFGSGTDYTHTLVSDDLSSPIDENTVLWIGREPEEGTPHNFIVVRVARSLNGVTYAVKEAKVTAPVKTS